MNKSSLSIFPLGLPRAMPTQKSDMFGSQDSDPGVSIHHFYLNKDKSYSN